jgi:hypothetical protein
LSSRQTTNLGASPWLYPSFPTSCPFRVLLINAPRPTRRYPRLWIWRPSSERQRDFNPPDLGAAQHTLRACPPPHTAEPGTNRRLVPHGVLVESHDLSPLGLPLFRRFSLPCMPTPLPRRNRPMLSLSCRAATAFPKTETGRLPQFPFRGLLSVHSCYGPHAR